MSEEHSKKIPNYDPPVTVRAGEIQFIEACHPPLTAGDYTVNVRQDVKEKNEDPVPWNSHPYAASLDFTVEAPRFTLNPADIHSVYPPVNESGRYDNALPHVVFTRRTLPWERTIDGVAPRLGQPYPPWMALVLFEEEELHLKDQPGLPKNRIYEPKSIPVFSEEKDSLLRPADGGDDIRVPDWGQFSTDSKKGAEAKRERTWLKQKPRYKDASCLAIDLPYDLFRSIAPRCEELPLLAHARQIDTGNKEVMGQNDCGWFSLVIGNRVPAPNKRHQALLVSLEGHADSLKDDALAAAPMIRLVVLAGWHFTCEGTNDFKTMMQGLDGVTLGKSEKSDLRCLKDAWLHLPLQSESEQMVQQAYAMGYTAFNHTMRQGEQTVSWYRGPLVPIHYNTPTHEQEPVECADELLRYDPHNGLFDTTYAAAWQIGRLLALQNHSFALALNRARVAMRQRAERNMRRDELKRFRKNHDMPEERFIEDSFMKTMAGNMGLNMMK